MASAREPEVNPASYERSLKHKLQLRVVGEDTVDLPVILIRGSRPGPTLVVTAGVHGDEYEGVRAIFEIVDEIDAVAMSGDLICVPVCNPPAFWNVVRCSPVDGANLARVFPGRSDGILTERIAWTIDNELLPLADFYLDLHSAGVRFLMPTMVGYEAGDSRAEAAARAFGAPVLWAHDVIAPGRTVSAARARRIPWLYTEARGAGRIHLDDLAVYRNGIRNLMRHLGILPGDVVTRDPEWFLFGDGNVDDSITSDASGFLVPEVELLQNVDAGERLGRLLDLYGQTIRSYAAPRSGVVALIHACPLIQEGDPLFLITGSR